MTNNINKLIISAMEETNPWWKEELRLDFKSREIYSEIKRFFRTKQIIALTGLRRVGKTTIMLKLIQDHIKELEPTNILYFSFDEFRNVRIREIINIYARIMNKDLNKNKYIFLFDEIQKLDNWDEQIKRIYDNFKNIKIIISGSESLFIRKKSKESLAGRLFEFKLNSLNFKEYLQFTNKRIENISLYKEEILREFNNFLFCNGFPEMVNEDREIIKKYIKENIIEKIIYRDIPQILPIQNPSILEEILKIIMFNPGQIISIDNISKDLGISRQTISLYLGYLEKSFLIKKLYNFSKNMRKTQRKLKKYYPTILLPEIIEKEELIGKVFEAGLVLGLDAEFFWRDQYKNEIDVVKIADSNILPIEIKYSRIDSKSLKLFMKKFKIKKGLILTYDKKEHIILNGKEVDVIPFYEYLLRN